MDLYLVLFGIAALGVLALLLIVWGRGTKSQQNPTSPMPEPALEIENVPETNRTTASTTKIEPTISFSDLDSIEEREERIILEAPNPALASLGFNALDGLLAEPEPAPIIAAVEAAPVEDDLVVDPNPQPIIKKEFIVLYLIAPPDHPFVGYELLQSLQAAGLHYGEMNIFHYYASERKQKLFSVASAVEPGIFDLANIGAFSCPGLSLFMLVAAHQEPLAVFDLLLETAEQLAEDLHGTLCDDERRPLTAELIAQYKNELH